MVAAGWRNRIVRTGEEAPDQLLANPKNWRIHPKHQQAALEGVLGDVGWVQQVIVNERTGHVVDGHLRVSLALRRDEPRVPVVYVDLSEDEEALILATLDPITALAAMDREQLGDLLTDVHTSDAGLRALLTDLEAETAKATFADAAPRHDSRDVLGQWREQGFVKVVIGPTDAGLFEEAMTATGIDVRSEALAEICRTYLNRGVHAGDTGQQQPAREGAAAAGPARRAG